MHCYQSDDVICICIVVLSLCLAYLSPADSPASLSHWSVLTCCSLASLSFAASRLVLSLGFCLDSTACLSHSAGNQRLCCRHACLCSTARPAQSRLSNRSSHPFRKLSRLLWSLLSLCSYRRKSRTKRLECTRGKIYFRPYANITTRCYIA